MCYWNNLYPEVSKMKGNNKTKVVEETGQKYNEIIFEEDYIPKDIYIHQIKLRNDIINQSLQNKKCS